MTNEIAVIQKSLNTFLNEGRAERTKEFGKDHIYIQAGPVVKCADGYEVSIQASQGTYCTPRVNLPDCSGYDAFELGFPNTTDELIDKYAEDRDKLLNTVYPYVPRLIIEALIEKHGGITS
jgi:hypothetical protein